MELDKIKDLLKPVASNPLPKGPPFKAEDTETLLIKIDEGQSLELLKELAGRGMEEPYKTEVLRYLASKLSELEDELKKAYLEWAELWDEIGLADLRSDYLVKGGGIRGIDLFRSSIADLNKVHITTQKPGDRKAFHLNFLCGKKVRPFSGYVIGPYRKPVWRDPSALKGDSPKLCPNCKARLERMFRKGLKARIKSELDTKLEYIWLDDRDQELIKAQAVQELGSLLDQDMSKAGDPYHPYDPPTQDKGDSGLYLEGEPLSARIRKMSKEAARRAYAIRTLEELDRRGDKAFSKIMSEAELNALRAYEAQEALRLVDLLEAEDLYFASLPHLRQGPFSTSFATRIREIIARRAKAPAHELNQRALEIVEARHQAEVRTQEQLEQAAERELILRRLNLKAENP